MSGPIRISLIANGRQARAELARTGAAGSAMGRSLSRAGKLIAGAFAVREIARAAAAVTRVGNAYTSELAKINALTTAQQRAQVGGIAGVAKVLEANRAQYAKYGSTVGDAAAGVTELVKAGQTLPNALKEINATMVLAKAGELSVADASSLVATSMSAFGLKAKQAGVIANDLANAANISTANVSDLAEALKFVAPQAHASGVSIKETTAYLAELSNAGINGTLAGTGLRKVMQSLQAPTGTAAKALKQIGLSAFDSQGKAKPFASVMQDLQKRLSGLNDQAKKDVLRRIFGLTGVNAAQVMLNNVDALGKYEKGITRAGAAEKLAKANSAGLVGALNELKANAISAAQAFYRKYSPVVEKALRGSMDWFTKHQGDISKGLKSAFDKVKPVLADLATALQQTATVVRDVAQRYWPLFADAIKATVNVVGGVLKVFNAIPGPLKSLALQAGLSAVAFGALSRALVAFRTSSLVTGILAARASMLQLRAEMTYTATRAGALKIIMGGLGTAAKQAAGIGGMLLLTKGLSGATKAGGTFGDVMAGAAGGAGVGAMFGPVGALIGAGVGGGLTGLISAFHHTKSASEETRKELARKAGFAEAKKDAQSLADALQGVIDKYGKVVEAAVQQSFIGKDGKLDKDVSTLRSYGLSMKTITEAALGNKQAIADVNGAFAANGKTLADATKKAQDYYKLLSSGGNNAHQVSINGRVFTVQKKDIDAARKAWQDAKRDQDDLSVAQDTFNKRIGDNNKQWETHVATMRRVAAGVGLTMQQYKALPKSTRMSLETNFPQTGKQALDVIGKYKQLQNFKSISTIVKASNVQLTAKQVNELATKYKLTPKQVSTLVKTEGLDTTRARLKAFVQQYGKKSIGTASLLAKVNGLDVSRKELALWAAGAKKTGSDAGKGTSANYASGVRSGTGNAKAAGSNLGSTAVSGMRSGGGGAYGVGDALGAGFYHGMGAWAGAVANEAANMVRSAIAAAKAAADSHSPSRKTKQLGAWFTQGYELGIKSRTKQAAKEAKKLAGASLDAFRDGLKFASLKKSEKSWIGSLFGVGDAQTEIDRSAQVVSNLLSASYDKYVYKPAKKKGGKGSWVEKTVQLLTPAQKREVKSLANSFKTVGVGVGRLAAQSGLSQKALRSYFTAKELKDGKISLNEVAAAQGRLNTQISNAQSALQTAKQAYSDYKNSVVDSVKGSVNITDALSQVEGGPGSTSRVLAFFHKKVQVARTYFNDVRRLANQGLSQYFIDQLVSYGPDALPLVQSLLAGGQKAIRALNADATSLANTANGLGTDLANKYYQAGINAAQGLLDGLLAKKKRLNNVAVALADDMVKEIKKKLKIHSPSKVFKGIGDNVVKGLVIGLDDTYVKRQGAQIAASLQKGFGQPQLSAVAAYTGASKPAPVPITITVQTGVGDPVAIGKEISRVMKIAANQGVGFAR